MVILRRSLPSSEKVYLVDGNPSEDAQEILQDMLLTVDRSVHRAKNDLTQVNMRKRTKLLVLSRA